MGLLDAPAYSRAQADALYAAKVAASRNPAAFLTNPSGLRRARVRRGQAIRSRIDIVIPGNSIAAGQGASGNPSTFQPAGTYAWTASDNYNGWVGQLRTLLNAPLGIDPGEGFIFANDPRVTFAGTAATYQFIGPMRNGGKVPNGQTATLALTAAGTGVPALNYVGIIIWDQATNSLPTVTVAGTGQTMKTTPGGTTNLTTTGTGAIIVGYVAATAGQSVVVTGGTSDTYVAGFDLVGATTGFHVHRMGQPGYVTGDLLGGELSGSLVASTGTGGQMDRVVRSTYQWCPNPGLIIIGHMDVNDWGAQNVTKTVTVTTTTGSSTVTITSGSLDATDAGKNVSGTGIPGGATLSSVFTNGAQAILSANATASGSATMTVSGTGAISGITPTLAASWLTQFLTNSAGTPSTGPLALGWSALIIGGPRTVNDGALPLPAFKQSQYIAAQAGIINTADTNLQHVAALDLSKVWGSTAAAHTADMPLQGTSSVHPSLAGHGDIAWLISELLSHLASDGALATSVPG